MPGGHPLLLPAPIAPGSPLGPGSVSTNSKISQTLRIQHKRQIDVVAGKLHALRGWSCARIGAVAIRPCSQKRFRSLPGLVVLPKRSIMQEFHAIRRTCFLLPNKSGLELENATDLKHRQASPQLDKSLAKSGGCAWALSYSLTPGI